MESQIAGDAPLPWPVPASASRFLCNGLWRCYTLSLSCTSSGNGLVVSTPDAAAFSIPAFSTCLFHVVPRVLGSAADEKTGPIVPYGSIKPAIIVSIYLVGPSAIIG